MRLYLKGAIEQVLKTSKKFLSHGEEFPLTDEKIREFIVDSNQMAARGLRGKRKRHTFIGSFCFLLVCSSCNGNGTIV